MTDTPELLTTRQRVQRVLVANRYRIGRVLGAKNEDIEELRAVLSNLAAEICRDLFGETDP